MRYSAVATDFDGTFAKDGIVSDETIAAVQDLRASGRKCILVTGRRLPELRSTFPHLDIFDRIVAENGVLLYSPAAGRSRSLVPSPPDRLVEELIQRGVTSLDVGEGIVGTWQPYEEIALEVIRDLGIEFQVVFNKGAVMLVPSGHNKGTGLREALEDLDLSLRNTVGIGDAENDHAFLTACELGVAVANALPAIKQAADIVTRGDHGGGVVEVIHQLIGDDLSGWSTASGAGLGLGEVDGAPFRVPAWGPVILIVGPSGAGKSSYAALLLSQLLKGEYQCCVIDPEGDYDVAGTAIGSIGLQPPAELVVDVLRQPYESATVNLLAVPVRERQQYLHQLLGMLRELRALTGRPHWIVIDEAHHMLYPPLGYPEMFKGDDGRGLIVVTVDAGHLAKAVLETVTHVVALGDGQREAIESFCGGREIAVPTVTSGSAELATLWPVGTPETMKLRVGPLERTRARHARKYAEADLGPSRSFYFRGPTGSLNLNARNLAAFIDLAEAVDEATWLYHLNRGDYSRWLRDCIGDYELAREAELLARGNLSATESRMAMTSRILRRYAPPA